MYQSENINYVFNSFIAEMIKLERITTTTEYNNIIKSINENELSTTTVKKVG